MGPEPNSGWPHIAQASGLAEQTEEPQGEPHCSRERIAELERVVSAQTEQVKFLAEQLQRVVCVDKGVAVASAHPTRMAAARCDMQELTLVSSDKQDDSTCQDDEYSSHASSVDSEDGVDND